MKQKQKNVRDSNTIDANFLVLNFLLLVVADAIILDQLIINLKLHSLAKIPCKEFWCNFNHNLNPIFNIFYYHLRNRMLKCT
jgi:hypothetical protein